MITIQLNSASPSGFSGLVLFFHVTLSHGCRLLPAAARIEVVNKRTGANLCINYQILKEIKVE